MPRGLVPNINPLFIVNRRVRYVPELDSQVRNFTAEMAAGHVMKEHRRGTSDDVKTIEKIETKPAMEHEVLDNILGDLHFRLNDVCLPNSPRDEIEEEKLPGTCAAKEMAKDSSQTCSRDICTSGGLEKRGSATTYSAKTQTSTNGDKNATRKRFCKVSKVSGVVHRRRGGANEGPSVVPTWPDGAVHPVEKLSSQLANKSGLYDRPDVRKVNETQPKRRTAIRPKTHAGIKKS